jgi:magnesium chelatase family protein
LDELPEFKRTALEVLRQPLEDGSVVISRAKMSVEYPAEFILVASMNPCPCGYFTHPEKKCTCSPVTIQKYLSKLSGPLLDRIDIHIEVEPVKLEMLQDAKEEEASVIIQERIYQARDLQMQRFDNQMFFTNSQMRKKQLQVYCKVDSAGESLLKTAMEKLHLSGRAYDKILKISRTIADLAKSDQIKAEHIAEAIHYRSLDKI